MYTKKCEAEITVEEHVLQDLEIHMYEEGQSRSYNIIMFEIGFWPFERHYDIFGEAEEERIENSACDRITKDNGNKLSK